MKKELTPTRALHMDTFQQLAHIRPRLWTRDGMKTASWWADVWVLSVSANVEVSVPELH